MLGPFKALRGDPRDADVQAEIEESFSPERIGITPDTLTVEPGTCTASRRRSST
jgi:hypothetical protein